MWIATDNDGLDDAIGQTLFMDLGTEDTVFGQG